MVRVRVRVSTAPVADKVRCAVVCVWVRVRVRVCAVFLVFGGVTGISFLRRPSYRFLFSRRSIVAFVPFRMIPPWLQGASHVQRGLERGRYKEA